MSSRCRFAKRGRAPALLRTEPFRLFFPAGLCASVLGVALWPLLYAEWIGFYPGESHARLMIQGFVGGFAIGFLGTATPKMLESPALTWPELILILGGWTASVALHVTGRVTGGDAFFLGTWILFMGGLAARAAFLRRDLPPPGFVLAGMGILAGLAGTAMLLIARLVPPTEFQRTLAHLLLYEGFILGPILGVGSFLFPRFFKGPTSDTSDVRSWSQRACLAFLLGLGILATYVAQAAGLKTSAPILRSLLVMAVILPHIPLFQRHQGTGSLSTMLRTTLLCLILGLFISGISLVFAVGIKHLLFIGGYGLLILAIASRVTWGHAGKIDQALGKRRSLQWITGIVLLAVATRMVADFIPAIRISHHIYAALSWVVAAVIWSWAVLRHLRSQDPTDS